jgi:hypothetical protein
MQRYSTVSSFNWPVAVLIALVGLFWTVVYWLWL